MMWQVESFWAMLVLDEAVNAVQCDPAVVADDTSAAVSVGKTGNDVGGSCSLSSHGCKRQIRRRCVSFCGW